MSLQPLSLWGRRDTPEKDARPAAGGPPHAFRDAPDGGVRACLALRLRMLVHLYPQFWLA